MKGSSNRLARAGRGNVEGEGERGGEVVREAGREF